MPATPSSLRSGRHGAVVLLLLASVSLFAISPLLVHGCSCGHDFDFHLLSWFEAATQIAHGNLHPHWAFTPAWNAGEPRFVFYPPLSWYIGALLGLIMPWAWTPIVYTWLALTAAGLSCYYLLRDFALSRTALLVAALYTVNPYMLFTAYERTAYAELLCAAWLPLLLHGILRDRITIPRIALPVALLWLTNAPAAVLGTYGLALLALVRILQDWVPHLRGSLIAAKVGSTTIARNTAAGTALGLGLAAFYILPAAYQRQYVEIALVKAQSLLITDNFLFARTGDPGHDAVLHTASVIAVILLALTVSALVTNFLRNKQKRHTLIALATLTAAIAFLLTSLSTPIWHHAPQLAFLQFPWRFLALLAPILALALAINLSTPRLDSETWVTRHTYPLAFLLAFALLAPSVHVFFQPCDDEDTPAARLALFHSPAGTEPTDEYTPNTADEDALAHANPPYWLAANAEAPAPANAAPGPLQWPIDLNSPTQEVLILNLRNYPAWRITRNRTLITERLERPDGLIALPIPPGPSHLEIAYATTPDQTIGWVLSAFSIAALGFTLRRGTR